MPTPSRSPKHREHLNGGAAQEEGEDEDEELPVVEFGIAHVPIRGDVMDLLGRKEGQAV